MIDIWKPENANQVNKAWLVLEGTCKNVKNEIYNYDTYKQKVTNNGVILCAGSKGDPLGMLAFYCNDYNSKVSYITQVVVSEEAQGQGIASQLLQECESYSKKNGMTKIKLEVLESNNKAISVYTKNGFGFDGKISDISIYMSKEI